MEVRTGELAQYPEWLVEVAATVTHLGDYATVVFVAGIAWLVFKRDRAPWMVAAVVGGIWVVSAAKSGFALPRPPGAEIGGYGFPSGHAFAATVCYGLLAHELDVGSRRSRFAVATVIVSVVGMSRVIIGVHYPVDVVVGTALGVVWLTGVLWGRRKVTE